MAYKSRDNYEGSPTYGEYTIQFHNGELLRVERLLTILNDSSAVLTTEEQSWLSNAMDLFHPESATGGYGI